MLRASQNQLQLQRQAHAGINTTFILTNQTTPGRINNSSNNNNGNTGAAEPVQGIPIYCNHTPYTSANYTGPGQLNFIPPNPLPSNIDPAQLLGSVNEDSDRVVAVAGPFTETEDDDCINVRASLNNTNNNNLLHLREERIY